MKTASIVLAVFAIGSLMYLPQVFHLAGGSLWLLDLWISLSGILLLLVSFGIWTRKRFAWYLGFAYLLQAVAWCEAHIYFTTQEPSERLPFALLGLIPMLAVGVYWAVVWYRQRKWFYVDQVA